MSGDTVVVGAYQEGSNATGVNGNQNDDSAANSGAAYVFVRSGTNWIQQAYLKASNTGAGDNFGRLGGGVGRHGGGRGQLESQQRHRRERQSRQQQRPQLRRGLCLRAQRDELEPAGLSQSFQHRRRRSLRLVRWRCRATRWWSGPFVRTAAPPASTATRPTTAPTAPARPTSSSRSGTNWSQQAYLKASNTDAGDAVRLLGRGVGRHGRGRGHGEDSTATGVNGNQNDNSAGVAGAAYVFVRERDELEPAGLSQSLQHRRRVTTSATRWRCRATRWWSGRMAEDSSATGVNGRSKRQQRPAIRRGLRLRAQRDELESSRPISKPPIPRRMTNSVGR